MIFRSATSFKTFYLLENLKPIWKSVENELSVSFLKILKDLVICLHSRDLLHHPSLQILTISRGGNYLTSNWYSPKSERTIRCSSCHYHIHWIILDNGILNTSSQNKRFNLITFSYSIYRTKLFIGKECTPFRGLPLNGFICTPTPSLKIYMTEALLSRCADSEL